MLRGDVERSLDNGLNNMDNTDLSKMKSWVEKELKHAKNNDNSFTTYDWTYFEWDKSFVTLLEKWNSTYEKLDADKKVAHTVIVESTRWSIHNEVITNKASYNFSTANEINWTLTEDELNDLKEWDNLKVKIKNNNSTLRLRDWNKKIIWKLKQWEKLVATGKIVEKEDHVFVEVSTSKWEWWVSAEYVSLVEKKVVKKIQAPSVTNLPKKNQSNDWTDEHNTNTGEDEWEADKSKNTWDKKDRESWEEAAKKTVEVTGTIDSISNYFNIEKSDLSKLTDQLKENWLNLDIVAYLTTYKKYIETNLVWLDDNILEKIKKAIHLRILELSKIVDERIAWVDEQIEEWDYKEVDRIVEIQNQRWIINSKLNDLFTEVNNEILPSAVILAKQIDLKPLKKTLSTPSWIWMNHKMFEIEEMFEAELTDDWEFNKTWASLELIDASANYWSVLDSSDEDHKAFMDENKIPGIEGASLLKDKNDINIERNASFTFYALLLLQVWAEFTPIWWTAWAWIDAADMFTDEDVLLKTARAMPWVDSNYRMEKVWYDNVLAGVWLIPGATVLTKWDKLYTFFKKMWPNDKTLFMEMINNAGEKMWIWKEYLKIIKEKVLWIKFNKKPKAWNNINIFDVEADAKIKLDKLNLENPNDLFFIRKTVNWKFEVFTTLKSDKLEPILENGKLSGYVFKHTFKKDKITVSAKLDENGKFVEIIDANWKTPWVIKWQITREMKKIKWEEKIVNSNKVDKSGIRNFLDDRYEKNRFRWMILKKLEKDWKITLTSKGKKDINITKEASWDYTIARQFTKNKKSELYNTKQLVDSIDESYKIAYINKINGESILKIGKWQEYVIWRSIWSPLNWKFKILEWWAISKDWKKLSQKEIDKLIAEPKFRTAILSKRLDNLTAKEAYANLSKLKWFEKFNEFWKATKLLALERSIWFCKAAMIWWLWSLGLEIIFGAFTGYSENAEAENRALDLFQVFLIWASWWIAFQWVTTSAILLWKTIKGTTWLTWAAAKEGWKIMAKYKKRIAATTILGFGTFYYLVLKDDDTETTE